MPNLRLSLLALLLSSLYHIASAAVARPLLNHRVEDFPGLVDHDSLLDRRQSDGVSGFTVVTGIQGTSPQPRLEIRQLEKDVDQWNLFMLGLTRFMATNQSEKLSYYQIAGIHGRPYVPWDGVGPGDGISSPGYCIHLSQLLLPWHRPYLALYEQTLYSHIVAAVNSFPAGATRTKYAIAALSWRHPYWDWAADPPAGQSVYPSSISNPTVTVNMPNGTNTIPNPLYSYRFHSVSRDDFYYDPWSEWTSTLRDPLGGQVESATSQDNLVGPILDYARVSSRDRLYNLFTFYSNFSEFGTESYTFGADVKNADSLESIHDVIHGITGSGGHMTYLDYSAFDPIFWLHHTMIDRSFALWQALYPDSYVQPTQMYQNSFTIQQGQTVDANTPLDPFHSSQNGTRWTSQTARSTRTFGYTYPELANNANTSSIKAAINRLYGGDSSPSNSAAAAIQPSKRFIDDTPEEPSLFPRDPAAAARPKQLRREYIANIVSEKFALNGSYAIYVFLGDFDSEDPSCWPTNSNLVGTHAIFAALPGDSEGNGMSMSSGMRVTGTVPLTSALLDKAKNGDLKGLRKADVEGYLRENLGWSVRMFNGTAVPNDQVPGLNLKVVGADVQPATTGDQFPKWGNFAEVKQKMARDTCSAK
ncbi:hypothetical protein LTR95_015856 [Oleoguttula sp. CCFEE 5521]